MTRVVLVAALLLGSTFMARADNNVWNNILHRDRADYEVHRAAEYCTARVGHDRNGAPTSAAFKRCMRSRGWAFDHTDVDHYDPTFDTCPLALGC